MQKYLIWRLAILGALYLFLSRDRVPCSVATWRVWCTACFSVRHQVANVEVRFNSYTAGAMIFNSYYSSARVAQPKKETSEENQCHWRFNSNVQCDFYLCFCSEKRPAGGRMLSVFSTCATNLYLQTELTMLNQCHWRSRPVHVIVLKAQVLIITWTMALLRSSAPVKSCQWTRPAAEWSSVFINFLSFTPAPYLLWHLRMKEAYRPDAMITLIGVRRVINLFAELKTQLPAPNGTVSSTMHAAEVCLDSSITDHKPLNWSEQTQIRKGDS